MKDTFSIIYSCTTGDRTAPDENYNLIFEALGDDVNGLTRTDLEELAKFLNNYLADNPRKQTPQ